VFLRDGDELYRAYFIDARATPSDVLAHVAGIPGGRTVCTVPREVATR
jgi:hypothetical protein